MCILFCTPLLTLQISYKKNTKAVDKKDKIAIYINWLDLGCRSAIEVIFADLNATQLCAIDCSIIDGGMTVVDSSINIYI